MWLFKKKTDKPSKGLTPISVEVPMEDVTVTFTWSGEDGTVRSKSERIEGLAYPDKNYTTGVAVIRGRDRLKNRIDYAVTSYFFDMGDVLAPADKVDVGEVVITPYKILVKTYEEWTSKGLNL